MLGIPLPHFDMDNSFCWGFTGSGDFNIKSATWLAHAHVDHWASTWEFKWIWKMDVPPKIIIFLWQKLHNALPIRGNFLRRDFGIDPACPFCDDDIESNDHLFWECPFTQKLWTLASQHSWLHLHTLTKGPQCATQLVLQLQHNHTRKDMEKAAFLLGKYGKQGMQSFSERKFFVLLGH